MLYTTAGRQWTQRTQQLAGLRRLLWRACVGLWAFMQFACWSLLDKHLLQPSTSGHKPSQPLRSSVEQLRMICQASPVCS